MANSKSELVKEVRSFGQYSTQEVSDGDLKVAIDRAKKHLKQEAGLEPKDIDWYGIEAQESALFWTSMLFSKVQTGALDAKTISVGAVNEQALLARSGNRVTIWFEKYRNAKNALTLATRGNRVGRTNRTKQDSDRYYEVPGP